MLSSTPSPEVAACESRLVAWRDEYTKRESTTDRARAFLAQPSTLRRYAVARNADAGAAIRALEATCVWREAALAPPLNCFACDADPLASQHCFFPIGFDDIGRLVVYGCAARAANNNAADAVRHMAACLEHAFSVAGAARGEDAYQWVWPLDFKGFGMWHAMQSRTSSATVNTFSNHFPERLGAVIMVNPPTVLEILLAVMRPLLDARTLGKVKTLQATPDTIEAALKPFGITDERQIAFMRTVMKSEAKPANLPDLKTAFTEDIAHLHLPRLPARPAEEWTKLSSP